MPAKRPKETKRSSDEAVKAKTGKVWAEWFEILDKAGAKKWPHKEISAYLYEKRKVPSWWWQWATSMSAVCGRNFRNATENSALRGAGRWRFRWRRHTRRGRMGS